MAQAIQPIYAFRDMRTAEMVAWFQQHSSTAAQQHSSTAAQQNAHAGDVGEEELPNHDS
ncbi:hypothetical protein [Streptomyces prasinus]|uniref:hypothetical protein n=1 Tax=Streptomyces prasinus TaxID=67345 RepID=UPI0036864692